MEPGWTMDTLVSALGVWCFVRLDTPTGAIIVCTFDVVLILMFLVHLFVYRKGNGQPPPETAGAPQPGPVSPFPGMDFHFLPVSRADRT